MELEAQRGLQRMERHAQPGSLNTLWVMETSIHPAARCSLATFLLAPFSCAGSLSPPWLMEPPTSCLAHKGRVATFLSLSIGI